MKRPISSTTPGNRPVIKPNAYIHDAARKTRPMTAAHARAMGRIQSDNYKKLATTASEVTNVASVSSHRMLHQSSVDEGKHRFRHHVT